MKKNFSTKLDTDPGEGIMKNLKFEVRQLNNRIQLQMSRGSDEYNELPTKPEHDQTIVIQSSEFLQPILVMTLFQNNCQRTCATPYPKDKPGEEKQK